MEPLRFFEMVDLLEPHCPQCSSKINYGVSTRYSERENAHICLACGVILK